MDRTSQISIGERIRRQREYMGYTREKMAELLDITPKFCSDIELGIKGMSVPTLCRIASTLHLSTDYILFGRSANSYQEPIVKMLEICSPLERTYAEELLKTLLAAMAASERAKIGEDS